MEQSKINEVRIRRYEQAINKIDDYFEYRHDSDIDKEFVLNVLDNLSNNLVRDMENLIKL